MKTCPLCQSELISPPIEVNTVLKSRLKCVNSEHFKCNIYDGLTFTKIITEKYIVNVWDNCSRNKTTIAFKNAKYINFDFAIPFNFKSEKEFISKIDLLILYS
jgi:hypothetical protein